MICPNCGASVPDDSAFCTACGASISSQGTPSAAGAPETAAPASEASAAAPQSGKIRLTLPKTPARIPFNPDYAGIIIGALCIVVGSEGLAPGETKSYRLSVPKDYTIRSCTVSILDYD